LEKSLIVFALCSFLSGTNDLSAPISVGSAYDPHGHISN